jgi:hypothetical protein
MPCVRGVHAVVRRPLRPFSSSEADTITRSSSSNSLSDELSPTHVPDSMVRVSLDLRLLLNLEA